MKAKRLVKSIAVSGSMLKSRANARALVLRARRHSGLTEAQAVVLAAREVKADRKR